LPVDFSEASMRVFSLVRDRLAANIKEVVLINVVDTGNSQEELEALRAEAGDRLAAMRRSLEDAGIQTFMRIRAGVPSENIIKAAREEAVTLVMLATRGAGSIKNCCWEVPLRMLFAILPGLYCFSPEESYRAKQNKNAKKAFLFCSHKDKRAAPILNIRNIPYHFFAQGRIMLGDREYFKVRHVGKSLTQTSL
jgi:hypothetical protein